MTLVTTVGLGRHGHPMRPTLILSKFGVERVETKCGTPEHDQHGRRSGRSQRLAQDLADVLDAGSRRLRVHVTATRPNRAPSALGTLGMTDPPAMLDQVDVGLVHLVGFEHAEEQVVGVVG